MKNYFFLIVFAIIGCTNPEIRINLDDDNFTEGAGYTMCSTDGYNLLLYKGENFTGTAFSVWNTTGETEQENMYVDGKWVERHKYNVVGKKIVKVVFDVDKCEARITTYDDQENVDKIETETL